MIVFFGIAGKCHEDHKYQRYNIKEENSRHRQAHQGDVDVTVKKTSHILFQRIDMFSLLESFLQFITLLHLKHPEHHKRSDHKAGCDTKKQSQEGTVALRIFIDLLGIIPHLLLFFSAKRNQIYDLTCSGCNHEHQEAYFKDKYAESFYQLLVPEDPCSHHDHGQLCHGVSVFDRLDQRFSWKFQFFISLCHGL